jgi:hypothetical protein
MYSGATHLCGIGRQVQHWGFNNADDMTEHDTLKIRSKDRLRVLRRDRDDGEATLTESLKRLRAENFFVHRNLV